MAIFNLAELNWEQINALDRAHTVVLLPLSPIEEHGPHLPVGTDYLASLDLAARAAEILQQSEPPLTALLHPGLPLGSAAVNADFPGTISIGGKALRSVVVDTCLSLARHDFKTLVIINHHYEPEHVKAIQQAISRVTRSHGVRAADPLAVDAFSDHPKTLVEGLDLSKENHADFEETSFIKYKHPALLQDLYRELPQVHLNLAVRYAFGQHTLRRMGARRGYVGTPAKADPDYGRKYFEDRARLVAETALKLLRGDTLPEMNWQMKLVLKLVRLS
jgi:creatinine amidohydrolase